MIDWDELIQRYITEQRVRLRSEGFCRFESFALGKFTEYCRKRQLVFLSQVQAQHLQGFYAWLNERHKAVTCYGQYGSVRRYLKWATYRGHLVENPGRGWQPKVPPATFVRSVPTESQMVAMLEAPIQDTPQGSRDQVLLEYLYGTGLRVQECANVELPDLDLDQAAVTIRTSKNGEGRVLPLGPRLTALLREYLANVRPLLAKQDARGVFVDDRGQTMRYHTICARVRDYSRQACGTLFSVHSIRHAYATHLLIGGAPLWAVARLLGHKCIGSTAVYTRMLPLDVANEVKRTHPRAQRKARRPRPPKTPE